MKLKMGRLLELGEIETEKPYTPKRLDELREGMVFPTILNGALRIFRIKDCEDSKIICIDVADSSRVMFRYFEILKHVNDLRKQSYLGIKKR